MLSRISFVTILVLVAGSLRAGGTRVEVRVDGLSCPFCAYGLEKRLTEIEGVVDLNIDVPKGLVTFAISEGNTVAEQVIDQAIRDAGFTPREIKMYTAEKEE